MLSAFSIIALLSLAAWIFLALAWGGFWRADQRLPAVVQSSRSNWPGVVAVIPARNEAATIADVCQALKDQDYKGDLQIIVVDDNSDDGTAEQVSAVAGVLVLIGKPLEPGWSGKLWAQSQGIEVAAKDFPDSKYLLLTDADIAHDQQSVRRLVQRAESGGLDMVSEMVRLRTDSCWEKLLIPAFVFFFQKLYPFPRVNDPLDPMAAAAGGVMLLKTDALTKAGGLEMIKGAVIDDCTLAALIKNAGGKIWLGLSETNASLRSYESLGDIWSMVARTAYIQLKCAPLLLLGTLIGMVFLYLVPPLALILGMIFAKEALLLAGFLGWVLMAALYGPTLKLYGRSWVEGLGLPLAGALYSLMTVSSALRHWRGQGGAWKGRTYG